VHQGEGQRGSVTERRRYTKRQKLRVVGMAVVEGTTAAAEHAGVPESTLRYWMDRPEFAALRDKTRDQVADEMWATIQVGIKAVAEGLSSDAPLRDKATAVGILYDKFALLTGAATSRMEARDISGTLSDIDILDALREAQHLATGGGASEAVEGTPEG